MSDSSILASMKHGRTPSRCTAEVILPGPLDVAGSVEMFRRAGDDLIDRWDGEVLLRTVRLHGGDTVAVAARPTGTPREPKLLLTVDDPEHLDAAAHAVSTTWFATTPAAMRALTTRDPVVRAADRMFPGLRPALQPDVLTALVRSISAQQINLRFAAVVRARLAEHYGRRHSVDGHTVHSLDAKRLAGARAADLRALQFTTRKAESIIGVANAVLGGSLDRESLAALTDEQVIAQLVTLQGIGRWSAEWLLARTFGRPVVVAGDLGVRKAVGRAYFDRQGETPPTPLGVMPTEQQVRERTAHWGEAAGVAQQLLLTVLAQDRFAELHAEVSAGAAP
jgi:DNA-3-methyladenine glycosylase II